MNLIYLIFYVIIVAFTLLKTIYYAMYEIKTENNRAGGIAIISFAILVTIFTSIIFLIKLY